MKVKPSSRKPSKRPWLHGPVAWDVAQRANAILATLDASPKRFLSQRQTALILGFSIQPVRDWLRSGLLDASGPRKQIPIHAVVALVQHFQRLAQPYSMAERAGRFQQDKPRRPFAKLRRARFDWPKQIRTRTPAEIAKLVGCYPSTIIRAIHAKELFPDRRTPYSWEISRKQWERGISLSAFFQEK